jgi:hypothetical protein
MIKTLAELDRARADARRMVTRRALAGAATSMVPLPGVDIAADVGLLATLLPAISKRFDLDHDSVAAMPPHAAQRALVLAAGLGNSLIGRFVTRRLAAAMLKRVGVRLAAGSAAKVVPILGSGIAAGIGFAALRTAGNAHIDDCYATAKALIEDSQAIAEA